MHGISGRITQRVIQYGTSATTDKPTEENMLCIYIAIQSWVAGDQPYRQICSIGNAHANISAAISHMIIFHRIAQNSRARGVCSCSLYALDRKMPIPFPLPDADKKLNLVAMMVLLYQKKDNL